MNIRVVTNLYFLDKQKLQNGFQSLLANARSAGTKDLFIFPHGKQVSNAESDPVLCTGWGRSFYMLESQKKKKDQRELWQLLFIT